MVCLLNFYEFCIYVASIKSVDRVESRQQILTVQLKCAN